MPTIRRADLLDRCYREPARCGLPDGAGCDAACTTAAWTTATWTTVAALRDLDRCVPAACAEEAPGLAAQANDIVAGGVGWRPSRELPPRLPRPDGA
jgi:hypothetical protein